MPQAEIFLLDNPRRRKRKRGTRRRASAKQIAWRKKFATMFGRKKKVRASVKRNPRRAGRTRYKHRPVFFSASKRKLGIRSPLKRLNPKRRVSSMARRRKGGRRRFRRNPGFSVKGIMGGVKSAAMNAVFGGAAIFANKFIADKGADLLNVSPAVRPYIALGTALFVLPQIAKVARIPNASRAVEIAAAVEVYELGKQYLPAGVQSQFAPVPPIPTPAQSVLGFGRNMMPGNGTPLLPQAVIWNN